MSHHPVPPPDFAVTGGFGGTVDRRPGTVTAAGILAIGFGALIALGGVVLLVNTFGLMTGEANPLVAYQLTNGLLLLLLAVASILSGSLALLGRSLARPAVFGVLGAAAVDGVSYLSGDVMAVIVGQQASADELVITVLYLLAAGLAAVPVVLLATPAATRWFGNRRAAAAVVAPAPETGTPAVAPRPFGTVLAFIFLLSGTVVFIVDIIFTVVTTIADYQDSSYVSIPEVVLPNLGFVTPGLVVLIAASIGAGLGRELGRILGYAAASFLVYQGLYFAFNVPLTAVTVGPGSVMSYLHAGIGLVEAAAGVCAAFALSQPAVVRWFDDRRSGPVHPAGHFP